MGRYEELMSEMPENLQQVFKDMFDNEAFVEDMMMNFDDADDDKNGVLDLAELEILMIKFIAELAERVSMELPPPTPQDVKDTFDVFDDDANGVLSRDEYMDFAKTMTASILVSSMTNQ